MKQCMLGCSIIKQKHMSVLLTNDIKYYNNYIYLCFHLVLPELVYLMMLMIIVLLS